jgi:hypothetical protein
MASRLMKGKSEHIADGFILSRVSFGETLAFLLKVRIKALFTGEKAWLWNILRFFLLIFVMVNGWFYGYLYDAVLASDVYTFSSGMLDAMLQNLALVVVFMVNYVPAYRPRSEFVSQLYPVGTHFRTGINLICDQVHLVYGYVVVFILMMVIGGEAYSILHGLNMLLFLIMIISLERNVKVALEQVLPRFLIYLSIIGVFGALLGIYFALAIYGYTDIAILQSIYFTTLTTFALLLYFHLSKIAGSKRDQQIIRIRKRGLFKNLDQFAAMLYFRRRTTLFTIVMIVMSKLFVFSAFLSGFVSVPISDERLRLYYSLTFLLPVIPFSYVHNNAAGFFRDTWFSITLFEGSRVRLIRSWFVTLLPVLALDFGLTLIILLVAGLFKFEVILFIALCVSVFVPLGLLASIHHPRYIERLFFMQNIRHSRNNSSALYMFYFLLIIASMIAIFHFGLLIYAIIPVLLLSAYLFSKVKSWFGRMRYDLYHILFTEE